MNKKVITDFVTKYLWNKLGYSLDFLDDMYIEDLLFDFEEDLGRDKCEELISVINKKVDKDLQKLKMDVINRISRIVYKICRKR